MTTTAKEKECHLITVKDGIGREFNPFTQGLPGVPDIGDGINQTYASRQSAFDVFELNVQKLPAPGIKDTTEPVWAEVRWQWQSVYGTWNMG